MSFVGPIKCPHCEAFIDVDTMICPYCGTSASLRAPWQRHSATSTIVWLIALAGFLALTALRPEISGRIVELVESVTGTS